MGIGILVSVAAFLLSLYFLFSQRSRNYPPGPKGLPLIGIAREHPKTEFWKTYAQWGEEYGNNGLISFHVLGRRMVVLNSSLVAEDLLVRRSAIYSDRPFPPMARLMKREKSMFYISHNERFKMYRRFMHHDFNPVASQNHWSILEQQARLLVANVEKDPDRLFECLRRNAAAVTMKIAYGYTVNENNDHFVALAEESMRVGSLAGTPGKWLVDSIPLLHYIPSWFPGAGFKRQAKVWGNQLYTQSLEPHDWVKNQMAMGTWEPSFTSRLLESQDPRVSVTEHEDLVLWTAGAVYAAGADTSIASVKAFLFAMMLYPEIQLRAQAEVDSIIAKEHRLPTIGDRESMPYLEAVLKEVLRWAPPSPMGLFHCTAADDEYNGYFIPAKTTVIANIWAMLHDPQQYPDPFVFNPDRFLHTNNSATGNVQRDPLQLVFGFGRRICPGQHVAEATIFIQMATVLAALNISRGVDGNGQLIEPNIEFTTAIVSHVKPFAYTITRRPGKAMELLLQDIDA